MRIIPNKQGAKATPLFWLNLIYWNFGFIAENYKWSFYLNFNRMQLPLGRYVIVSKWRKA